MNKKIIYRILAGFLAFAFLAAGIFLLTPVFDTFLNKLNGIAFILFASHMARYSLTGKENFRKSKKGKGPGTN